LGDQIKENVIGGPCSTYEDRRGAHKGFRWANLRRRSYLDIVGVDGSIRLGMGDMF
jgi:hypothetical protein